MSLRYKLVGFHGEIGAGKNTCAQLLGREVAVAELAFAEALKDGARELAGFTREQVYGTQQQKEAVDAFWGFTPRWFLQQLGSALRDTVAKDFFVRRLELRVADALAADFALVCVTDVRYPEEAALVRKLGGVVVHVQRGPPKTEAQLAELHESEHPLAPEHVDCVVYNDGTLDELAAALWRIVT